MKGDSVDVELLCVDNYTMYDVMSEMKLLLLCIFDVRIKYLIILIIITSSFFIQLVSASFFILIVHVVYD